MEKYYIEFLEMLDNEDRYGCVNYVINLLEEKKINIKELYEKIIKNALERNICKINDKGICIWKEQERNSIIRTVIESCYIYAVKEGKEIGKLQNKKVVIFCPKDEYNDLEARMITDLFMISGYESIFVGTNVKTDDFIEALDYIKPNYFVISISNFYDLISIKHSIEKVKEKIGNKIKIYINSGNVSINKELLNSLEIDGVIENFSDISKLGGE